MGSFKGIIALDIDGTLTIEKHHLEKEVSFFLNKLIQSGWQLIFITGRTFSFTLPVLADLKGNYFLAVQNGAALYAMPEERLLKKNYLSSSFLPYLDEIFSHEEGGLLVESGRENRDICYYKPHDFDQKESEYIQFRISISPEKWIPLPTFDEFKLSEFAVGKYFASEASAYAIAKKINNHMNVIVIRDPFRPGFHLAHINQKQASKGKILDTFIEGRDLLVIGAGDDHNDLEMLDRCDLKIVMSDAPESLKEKANIIAPSAKDLGIIPALKEAIQRLST